MQNIRLCVSKQLGLSKLHELSIPSFGGFVHKKDIVSKIVHLLIFQLPYTKWRPRLAFPGPMGAVTGASSEEAKLTLETVA